MVAPRRSVYARAYRACACNAQPSTMAPVTLRQWCRAGLRPRSTVWRYVLRRCRASHLPDEHGEYVASHEIGSKPPALDANWIACYGVRMSKISEQASVMFLGAAVIHSKHIPKGTPYKLGSTIVIGTKETLTTTKRGMSYNIERMLGDNDGDNI